MSQPNSRERGEASDSKNPDPYYCSIAWAGDSQLDFGQPFVEKSRTGDIYIKRSKIIIYYYLELTSGINIRKIFYFMLNMRQYLVIM